MYERMRRFAWIFSSLLAVSSARTTLLETAGGRLQVQKIPSSTTTAGLVTIITSPGTPSLLIPEQTSTDDDAVLCLESTEPPCISCRGLTLSANDDGSSLATTCSLLAQALILDGVTVGDVQAGLQQSRHARTLTALFRAKVQLATQTTTTRQLLILGILGGIDNDDVDVPTVEKNVKALYKASAVEVKGAMSFDEAYDLQVVSVQSKEDAKAALAMAMEAAQSMQPQSSRENLGTALVEALVRVRDSGIVTAAFDTPHIANAFIHVGNAYNKQSRAVRAKISAWKGRVARGLWIDGFGKEAQVLRKRVLATFDGETLFSAGLPSVAAYRLEMRAQLQSLVDSAIQDLFVSQIANLETVTLKRFQNYLLQTAAQSAEDSMDTNAAALRSESFSFERVAEDLQVPDLGLSKDKAVRQMGAKLNDALIAFPDSPAAKIKRIKAVSKVVKKDKKPTQRAIEFGLDLVGVLRPDGFGSLQGYASYQLGRNSLTFGVHNDADDPATIAQFGGVRPPLLRVQPKLRVDVEL